MSLVEKAMAKSRGEVARKPAARAGEAAPPPIERLPVAQPQIQLTEELLRTAGLYAPETMPHQFAAECRRIRRRLLADSAGQAAGSSEVMQVTSVMAGEGKTFAAFHLAMSLIKGTDLSVLLIDADPARPRLSRALGVDDRVGLMDAATSAQNDVEDLVLSTNITGLSVLPVGRRDALVTDSFGGHLIRETIGRLRGRQGRLIVVDSPPLLQTTEALELTAYATTVLLVVRAGKTPRAAVSEALKQLADHPRVMVLLNGVEPPLFGKSVGYGFDYYDYSDYAPSGR